MRWKFGIGCCDIYGYNYYLAKSISSHLKNFKENLCSYPSEMTIEEWQDTIQIMIDGFDAFLAMDDEFVDSKRKKLVKKYKLGMKTFVKYFDHLWM